MIEKVDPARTFVTSDHHFGSWYVNSKPWSKPVFLKEEEEELVRKWNSVVQPDDLVLYNGDFHDCDEEGMREYRKRLNGRIILVKGNHDVLPDEVYKDGFDEVHVKLKIEDLNLVLNHVPDFDPDLKGFQVYGHLHDSRGLFIVPDEKRSFCSCVMRNDGYPVALSKILSIMEEKRNAL